MRQRRRGKQDSSGGITGALNLDKPLGITSHDAVERVRRLYGTRRVGHTGTLDPQASGVLPLLLGPATRFAEFLQHCGKTYQVVARLGLVTDTQDATGAQLEHSGLVPEADEVVELLHSFLGEGSQVPPMYSALKVGGRRLYELARAGQSVERASRPIVVDSITDVVYEYPLLSFRIAVSSGTYIRTICHDLGLRLGCGAIMAELRRLAVGPFLVETSSTLDELGRCAEAHRLAAVRPLEEVFAYLPAVRVLPEKVAYVGHGRKLGPRDIEGVAELDDGARVRVLSPAGKMLAMGQGFHDGAEVWIAPVRVLPEADMPEQDGRRAERAVRPDSEHE
jgi:tRNA pseudouridine55 synthase